MQRLIDVMFLTIMVGVAGGVLFGTGGTIIGEGIMVVVGGSSFIPRY